MADNQILTRAVDPVLSTIRTSFSNDGIRDIIGRNVPDTSSVVNLVPEAQPIAAKPESVESPKELRGVDYVGYLIEKQRFNKSTGSWVDVAKYKILGSLANNFVDTRLAYGNVYRYRIKSIIKFTYPKSIAPEVVSAQLTDLQKLRQIIEAANTKTAESDLSALKYQQKITQYPTSLGIVSPSYAIAPDKVLSLEGSSIVEKLAIKGVVDDAQSDLMHLEAASRTNQMLEKIGAEISNSALEKFDGYESIFFYSNYSRDWTYVDVRENVPPAYPSNWSIVVKSLEKKICLWWSKPATDQQDIASFNAYRRGSVGEAWTKIASLKDGSCYLEDKAVEVGKKYIYALTSVDVHGYESYLSAQYMAELNDQVLFDKKEKNLVFVSGPGLEVGQINETYKKFLNGNQPLIAFKNIKISPSKFLEEDKMEFIIKIKSLDTHEIKEIKLTILNEEVK